MTLQLFAAILVGILATAAPGVLERVQATRVRYGFGLTEAAPPGTVLLALEDCGLLGKRGVVVVDGESHAAYVVDCQQAEHTPLHELGLVADVDGGHPEFNGRDAVIVLR